MTNQVNEVKSVSVTEQAETIYDSLTPNEKFGLRFGLFPAHIAPLSAELAACLIGVAQTKSLIE
jgi:hypothetical protein